MYSSNLAQTFQIIDGNESDDLDSTQLRLHGGADIGKRNVDDSSQLDLNLYGDDEVELADDGTIQHRRPFRRVRRWMRLLIFLACWLTFTVLLMINHEHEETRILFCIEPNESLYYNLEEKHINHEITVLIKGPFVTPNWSNHSYQNILNIIVLRVVNDQNGNEVNSYIVSEPWHVHLVESEAFDQVPQVLEKQLLRLKDVPISSMEHSTLKLQFSTDIEKPIAIQVDYHTSPLSLSVGGALALLLILGLVVTITVHLNNYTVAAMFASTFGIAILAAWQLRPTLPVIMKWLDIDVLLLLFSLTIVTAVFADSGMLDYIVFIAYKFTNGHIWPFLHCVIVIALIFSLVLGSLFTILLLTPICIRYCEALELNPVPSLVILIIFTNLGSSFLPSNDSLRSSIFDSFHPLLQEVISFATFAIHILPGFALVVVHSYIHIRLNFIDSSKMRFTDFHRLQRVIRVWKHTANQISGYSKDEQVVRDTVMSKVNRMRQRLHRIGRMPAPVSMYEERLNELRSACKAHSPKLLIICFIVLLLLIIGFITHVFTTSNALSRGWIALLATILLLILTDMAELESILPRIDWSSMIFLAAMNILTYTFQYMGFFYWIVECMHNLISLTNTENRLTVGLIIIMWTTALSSSVLVENACFKIMLPLVMDAVKCKELGIPLAPMFWAFILGAATGNIGTIIGAVGNIVCAGIAEKHDYNMTFWYFFKISVPIMLINLIILTAYLMVAHVVYQWH